MPLGVRLGRVCVVGVLKTRAQISTYLTDRTGPYYGCRTRAGTPSETVKVRPSWPFRAGYNWEENLSSGRGELGRRGGDRVTENNNLVLKRNLY
jgi:hypothetical protein